MNKELYNFSYEMKKDFHKKIFRIISFVFFTCLFISLVLKFFIFPVREKSVSMEPDIPPSSCIFFSPLSKSFKRGDVVLLKALNDGKRSFPSKVASAFVSFFTARFIHLSNLGHYMGNEEQIRRVLALPGDTIYMRDYVLYIKPENDKFFLTEFELVKKPYNVTITSSPAFWDNSLGAKGSFEEITLNEGEYFVLADNRNSSVDSRLWGIINKDRIEAGALLQYFPFNKLKIF